MQSNTAMLSIEDKYIYTTIEDAVREKDWACGTTQSIESMEFLIRKASGAYVGSYEAVRYPPALWKIIDEIIVNALDQFVRCLGTATPVTFIKIQLERTGRIKVTNNGPGIEIALHRVASEKLGRPTWVPTLIFGSPFQGMNRHQAADSIVGGTNGLGSKLTNCFSSDFVVENVSGDQYFVQRWRECKNVEELPNIVPVGTLRGKLPAERICPHTTVSFLPAYNQCFHYEQFDEPAYQTWTDLIRTRAFFAAAYASYAAAQTQNIEIWFNDERITTSISDIARLLFPDKELFKTTIVPTGKALGVYKYAWDICTVIIDTTPFDVPQLGIVNGIFVRDGKHYKHIMSSIINGVKENISKAFQDKNLKFSSAYVSNNVFLLLNTRIPKPSWTGQRKDTLDMDIRKFAGYVPDVTFIDSITSRLRDYIITNIMGNIPIATGRKKIKQTAYDKYKPARKTGTKHSPACQLITIEGDSAMSQISTGIAQCLGWDYYGAISLGGVIMNARKNCKQRCETETGVFVRKNAKLDNNIFMNVLSEMTGLNTAYKYDPASPTYRKEMAELRYGAIIACVDQDTDGKGHILGLLLNLFELFWPRLLAAGYIKWFCTPIVRAYPKSSSRAFEFYSIHQFEHWAATTDVTKYDIRYYKGIGSHDRNETLRMFSAFTENLHTYFADERTKELFEIYFGKDADLRKIELSRPIQGRDEAAIMLQDRVHRISCSEHLQYETFLYQKENLERMLDHVIDGQNQAGRKILNGILKALKKPNKDLKVAQLAGYISEHEAYHHGEAVVSDSIAGKAFITTGGKQLPFLVPLSQFGSRLGGGKDAAQPRYIRAKLNYRLTDLLFPAVDYWILPFNFDEGKRSEPRYFVPIVPLVIAESAKLPATGWGLQLWARDIFKVIENVRRLIQIDDKAPLLQMPPCTYKGAPYEWHGRLGYIRGHPYSFGRYALDDTCSILTITELPLRVWTEPYVKMLREKMHSDPRIIAQVVNESDDIRVNIRVKLRPGAIEALDTMGDIHYTDGVEEYFHLRDHMYSNINLMGISGEVLSFATYEAVMHVWFPIRRAFYERRIDRARVLKLLVIRKLENIIKYIEESNTFGFAKKQKTVMEAVLADHQYDRIDIGKLTVPKFIPTADLESVILRGPGANYDYLLKLSDLKKSAEALDARRSDLARERAELEADSAEATMGRFPGAKIWENELVALETNIREGTRTFWRYGELDKYSFE